MRKHIRENSRKDVPVLAGSELELVPIYQDLSGSPKLAERSCRKRFGIFIFIYLQ